jgi:alkaline phosphatase D
LKLLKHITWFEQLVFIFVVSSNFPSKQIITMVSPLPNNNNDESKRNGVAEWYDHWATMFPLVNVSAPAAAVTTETSNTFTRTSAIATPTMKASSTTCSRNELTDAATLYDMADMSPQEMRLEDTAGAYPRLHHSSTTSSTFLMDAARNSIFPSSTTLEIEGMQTWDITPVISSWEYFSSTDESYTEDEGTMDDTFFAPEGDEEDEFESNDFCHSNLHPVCNTTKIKTTTTKYKKKKRSKGRRSSSSRRNSKNQRRNRYWYKKHCDKTTTCLAITVVVLTIIVIWMGAVTKPLRKSGSSNNQAINNDESQGVADDGTSTAPSITSNRPPTLRPIPKPTDTATTTPSPSALSTTGYYSQLPSMPPSSMSPSITPTRRITAAPVATPSEPAAPAAPTAIPTLSSQPPTRPTIPAAPVVPVGSLLMGPLVGHTTHDSVQLWAYHSPNTVHNMELVVYDMFDQVLAVEIITPNPTLNNVYLTTVSNLQPQTSYKYGMHIQGTRVGNGHFTTAPSTTTHGSGHQFDYVLASCMNARQYPDQKVWNAIVSNNSGQYPAFSILAGDTIYLQEGVDVTVQDGVLLDRVWWRNQEQRADPYFADFIARVPTYAVWNDHDYGSNDSNKDQKGKNRSLQAFQSLWANPGYGDDGTDDGVYFSFYHGNVHFLVTDDQWFRDPARQNRLGDKQTEWIRQELTQSHGVFKVIVIGSDIMQRGWDSDLTNLGTIVTENRIEGVIFHSGDVHRNEYKSMSYPSVWPYPVTQITSSGIARVWRRPYVHIAVDTTLEDPTMTASFYGAANTNTDTTWINQPNLKCSSIVGVNREQEHSCTETIRLSMLKIPAGF